ncbi:MAG TPA: polysaccharide biosynthesis tyrosine autokinase [Elusimicrobiales bacterium]|nr:polysaccharide biosynthesis tyrosine autokinase [Elusimicrobiales bacterium]HOI41312.1 polysaccharide biosynthesis tyrosine autokinase [Elusimicrobiales bacterium]
MTEEKELEFDLTYYWDLLMRRRWVALSAWLAVVIVTALVTFNMRPVFQAQALLVIEKERGNNVVYQGGPSVERSNEDYYQTQYKLLKSEALLKTVHNRLDLGRYEEFKDPYGYRKLIKPVTIAPVPRSRLVYVKVDSHDRLLASRIANTIAGVFIEQNLSNQLFISKDVLAALQDDKKGQSRAIYESLPAVVNNPLIQQLKQDTARLQAQVAEASNRYTARHPQLMAMTANYEALKGQLKAETDKIIQSLKIDLSGQLMGNNIRLIDAAIPPLNPIKPRKLFNMLLAVIGGFVLAVFAAVLVEFIDQTVRTQEDVENKLGLPFLGSVPLTRQTRQHTAYNHLLLREHSLISESIRNLRTMVDFAEVGQKSRSFMVTSSVQGEGKSYVGANLATAFAQAGEKVLIVDGDLRRSNLHKLFRVSNLKGLSDFLAGGRNIEDVQPLIQETDVKGLSILTCGPRPPNPAELLNTPRLSAFLNWASTEYDRLVVDCPPMFPISDALLWGKYIKSCVFVTAFGKTRVPLIRNAARRLGQAGIKILGNAVNMAKFGGLSYSYYGYSYQYNYHYGPDAEEKAGKAPVKA